MAESGAAAHKDEKALAQAVQEVQCYAERLKESERRLDAVLRNATVAIFLMDELQQCVYMNRAAEKLTGYTLREAQGRPLHYVVHHTRPDGTPYPLEECPIDRAFPEHNQVQGEEIFVHKDGSFFPVAFTASPIRDEAAQVIGTIIEVRDIRAEKEAQRRQHLLINELNHRVKNTLATVQAIAAQSLKVFDPDSAVRRTFEGRLMALSRAHDVLTYESWMGAPIRQVVEEAVAPFCSDSEGCKITGPDARLPPKLALAIALALHELCTNAAKYGAFSQPGGCVHVDWSVDTDTAKPWLHLCWSEEGGPLVTRPTRRGFGTRLIETGLVREFGGSVDMDYRPEGLVCTITAPLISTSGEGHDHMQ